ncbi:MAG: hypothetical protein V3U24_00885 [Candidatus Neomarinimicrobiota bacterium]
MLKRIPCIFAIISIWLNTSCDFQSPSDFEVPIWNMNLTIPLLHEKYPLGNIVNDSTIHAGGDTIFLQFEGELPADSVNGDYLQIPLSVSRGGVTTITPPVVSDYFDSLSLPFSFPAVPVGAIMVARAIQNVAADPAVPVIFPSSEVQKIVASDWNDVASEIEAAFGRFDTSLTVLDFGQLFASIPFVQAQGIVIGGEEEDNFFESSIENVDLPLDMDSTWADLLSNEKYLARHDTIDLGTGSPFDSTTDLVGDTLTEALEIRFGFNMGRATDTVTIDANSEPEILMQFSMKITDLEKAILEVSEQSLVPDLDPISFQDASVGAEDCAVNGIYGGDFDTGTPSGINQIGISNVLSSFPFDIDFGIDFANFVSPESDTLSFGDTLSSGDRPLEDSQDLDGWSFANPIDPNQVVEEISVKVTANSVPDTVEIFLDGTEPDWTLSMGVDVAPLYFERLELDLECPFPTQTQEIGNVPQGFTGMRFEELILKFTMYNEIRLPIVLNLDIIGVSETGDSVRVELDSAALAIPDTGAGGQGDTARTVLKLGRLGTEVKIYSSAGNLVPDSTYTISKGEGGSIVDLLNIGPSEINVDAAAGINGRGDIETDKAIWGEYELIAPFIVGLDTMTFLPATSTQMDEMPNETRNQLRNSVKGAGITTRIVNSMPAEGELAMLFSDRNLFPLDRKSETLASVRDSLGWLPTDSLYILTSCDSLTPTNPDMYIFSVLADSSDCVEGVGYLVRGVEGAVDTIYSYVDTLLKVPLPLPKEFYAESDSGGAPGMTKVPGDTTVVTEIDTNTIALLTDLGDHYINTRSQFYGSEKTVFFSMRDTLEVFSFMTFLIKSTGLLGEPEDEIVIIYPNGGETFSIGEEVSIRWRSLGNEIRNDLVEVFLSTTGSPDIDDEGDWGTIQGPLANVDSTLWTPATTADSLWLRICNEDGSICDKSGWFFDVTSGLGRIIAGDGRANVNSKLRESRLRKKGR